MSFGKFIRVLLYLSTILGITLFTTLSIDIHIAVRIIVGSISLTSMIGLYAISLSSMYFGVALFTVFDRAHSSKVIKKNIFHSTLYTMGIIFLVSLSAYMQLSFVNHTRAVAPLAVEGNLNIVWQMIVARTILFTFGSPCVTYFTCMLPTRHSKTILARAAQGS